MVLHVKVKDNAVSKDIGKVCQQTEWCKVIERA